MRKKQDKNKLLRRIKRLDDRIIKSCTELAKLLEIEDKISSCGNNIEIYEKWVEECKLIIKKARASIKDSQRGLKIRKKSLAIAIKKQEILIIEGEKLNSDKKGIEKNEREIRKIRKKLEQINPKEQILKERNKNEIYCLVCCKVTIHTKCIYEDSAIGSFVGRKHRYLGFRCTKCKNIIYESEVSRRML